jgi:hypothetical protein
MKDSRFIELLNLYIDRQISAAETAELEAELQAHPRRQAVYRQYCQMHRATMLVGERFQAGAPQDQSAERVAHLRIASQQSRARARWAYYGGGLAAAACLAVALVRFQTPANPAPAEALAAAPSSEIAAAPVMVAAVPVGEPVELPATIAARPSLVSLRHVTDAERHDYSALLAALRRQERAAYAAGQDADRRVPSLFDDEVFETQRFWTETENKSREFRSRTNSSNNPHAEFTAFQFQR